MQISQNYFSAGLGLGYNRIRVNSKGSL